MTTRIPADVERQDRLIGPFTARQLVILAVTGLLLYLGWVLTRNLISPPLFVAGAVPLGTAAAVMVLTSRDGLSGDQLVLAALRLRLRDRRLVTAPQGVVSVPQWLTSRAAGAMRAVKRLAPQPLSSEVVPLPGAVTAGTVGIAGVIDLGPDGLATVAAAGTINLALRTPEEQDSLVSQLGGYLNALRQPVQIVIRTTRLDLTGRVNDLRAAAETMSPDLAVAAHGHGEDLAEMAADGDLLQRQVLMVWRESLDPVSAPTGGLAGPSVSALLGHLFTGRGPRRQATAAARRAAESRLLHRMTEAAELLAPLEITVTALDHTQASAVLTGACNPATLVPATADTAAPGTVVTAGDEAGLADFLDDGDPIETSRETRGETVEPRAGVRGWLATRRDRSRSGASVFAPESVTVGARHLEVGSDCVATLAVRGYPREVCAGWLAPLLNYPGRVDVSIHIEPVDPVTAAARLRRQMARLESSRSQDLGRGRLVDPQVDAAVEDAADLSARIARGEGRLFRVGIYLTVHAATETDLVNETAAVRALAASLLVDVCPVTYRAVQGWVATLPLGLDLIRMRRTLDTAALASAFPFNSPQLPITDPATAENPQGVLYGRDAAGGLLFLDRFGEQVDNHNAVILGRSGAGKSYFVKMEILRSLYRGVQNIVIDQEDEYRRLADAVGGVYVHLGAPGVRLNPLDLEVHCDASGRRTAPPDALTRRKLFLHTVIRVLLGEQNAIQRAVLDTALTATYLVADITDDPTTWTRPAPTLRDLRDQLTALGSVVADDLAAGLQPFVEGGAFAGLMDGPTTTRLDGGLVVFSLRELPDELRTIGTLLALDATWRHVANPADRRPRLVTVDEAWLLMRQPAGAEFLFRAAKALRKHWAGLTVATQDVGDVLGTDLGKAIISNAATQILFRQAPQAISEVGEAFRLSAGERQFLLSADRGDGLLSTGVHRAVFASIASPLENNIATTDPAFLAGSGSDYAAAEQHVLGLDGECDDGVIELEESN